MVNNASQIVSIQSETPALIRAIAMEVGQTAGPEALGELLVKSVSEIICAAHCQLGAENACALMEEGLRTARTLAEEGH